MKILSLLQPWAQLVVQGNKQIETRSWSTKYRGPLFIHASGQANKKLRSIKLTPAQFVTTEPIFNAHISNPFNLPFGKIIGMVNLVDVHKITNDPPPAAFISVLTRTELAFGNYELGRYMWLCSAAVEFKYPILCKGKLAITDAPPTGCMHCDQGDIPVGSYHRKVDRPCYNMIKA